MSRSGELVVLAGRADEFWLELGGDLAYFGLVDDGVGLERSLLLLVEVQFGGRDLIRMQFIALGLPFFSAGFFVPLALLRFKATRGQGSVFPALCEFTCGTLVGAIVMRLVAKIDSNVLQNADGLPFVGLLLGCLGLE